MAEDPRRLSDADLEQALVDLGQNMPYPPTPDIAAAVLESIAAAAPPPPGQQPPGGLTSGQAGLGLAIVAVAVAAGALLLRPEAPPPQPTPQKIVVWGGDLSEAQREELGTLLAAEDAAKVAVVSREELTGTLEEAGLPVEPTDKAISSTALTCPKQGEGLHIRTENITRTPPTAYATALIALGAVDLSAVIAAPSSNPVSGETALVGMLKALPECQDGNQPDEPRVNWIYAQFAAMAAMAETKDDLVKPSVVILKSVRAVTTGQASDEASIEAAISAAAAEEGLPLSMEQRAEAISLLKNLADLAHPAYAGGFEVQQLAPNEVKIVH
jgi:uncharacterized protein YpuA (DUF1002 family)